MADDAFMYIDGQKISGGGGIATSGGQVAVRHGTVAEQTGRAEASGRPWVMTADGPVYTDPRPMEPVSGYIFLPFADEEQVRAYARERGLKVQETDEGPRVVAPRR